ncbi:hypothetical protein EON65_05925 [archaeon]|nr:MAG: hypothetical protein EON65_05925 [archaeon]
MYQHLLLRSHSTKARQRDATFKLFSKGDHRRKRTVSIKQELELKNFQRLSKGLAGIIYKALELGIEDEEIGKAFNKDLLNGSNGDGEGMLSGLDLDDYNDTAIVDEEEESLLLYAPKTPKHTYPLTVETNIPYIQQNLEQARLNISDWPEKIPQAVLHFNPSKSSAHIHYDYLSTNSLFTIDAPPFVRREKNYNLYLKDWFLVGLKWGLLTEQLDLVHYVLSTFDVHHTALQYQQDILIQSHPVHHTHHLNTDDFHTYTDTLLHTHTYTQNHTHAYMNNPRILGLIDKYPDLFNTLNTRIRSEIRQFVDRTLSNAGQNVSLSSIPIVSKVAGGDVCTLDHTNYDVVFFNNITAHMHTHHLATVYHDHLYLNTSTGLLAPYLAYNSTHSSTHILDDVLVHILHSMCSKHAARVIAIGDVHGCVLEAVDLLRNVSYHPGDVVLFLGDLVAKGPYSPLVIQLCMDTHAVAVRGNHDQGVIYEGLMLANRGKSEQGSIEHMRIASLLTYDQYIYLTKLPYYVISEDLGSLFVHAGFDMNHDLTDQSSWNMLTMRFIKTGSRTKRLIDQYTKRLKGKEDFTRPLWGEVWPGPLKVLITFYLLYVYVAICKYSVYVYVSFPHFILCVCTYTGVLWTRLKWRLEDLRQCRVSRLW